MEVEAFQLLPLLVGKEMGTWGNGGTPDQRLASTQLKFLDRAVALAMTYLDVAATMGAGELRARCIERAIRTERQVTAWAHQLKLDPATILALVTIRMRLRSVN